MHFAALASVPDSIADPEAYYRVNVVGTKSVSTPCGLPGCVRSSSAAPQRPMASTPRCRCGKTPPSSRDALRNDQAGRRMADQGLCARYGFGYTLLRYFNASGADPDGEHGEDRRHESHLIPLIFQVALAAARSPGLRGDFPTRDGSCVRDYVHTEDLAQHIS